jgi:uncharacterized protein (TIGR02001 family)
MQKRTLALALLATLPVLGSSAAFAEEGPFSANVSLTSDYAYRGISQTDQRPALQGGFDFNHASGFYAGVWGSNVSWLRDAERGLDVNSRNSLELDLYAGYTFDVGPLGLDVGVLQYYYPGSYNSAWKDATGLENPNTTEGYVGLSWEFLSFKYSHAFTDLFGADDSENSQYFDLAADYEVMPSLTLNAHFGRQRITGSGNVDYNDWKVGATYSLGGFDLGLHYVDTDLSGGGIVGERVIGSVSKSF